MRDNNNQRLQFIKNIRIIERIINHQNILLHIYFQICSFIIEVMIIIKLNFSKIICILGNRTKSCQYIRYHNPLKYYYTF
ncbi:hypothetical protein pb186bvf_010115 [Paramecium bursaria]